MSNISPISNNTEKFVESQVEPNPFRQVPLRYLGYTNELGEAFRPLIPRWLVNATYGVAALYTIGDAGYQGNRDKNKAKTIGEKLGFSSELSQSYQNKAMLSVVGDTLIWQTLASLLVPPLLIHQATTRTNQFLQSNYIQKAQIKSPKLPWHMIKLWSPTLAGLAVIPLIVHPIDEGVTLLLDYTTRPLLRKWFEDKEHNFPAPHFQ